MRKVGRIWFLFLGLALFFASNLTFAKPVDIIFWHSFSGTWEVVLKEIVYKFNQEHPKYRIIPLYKGDYPETMAAFSAAFRAHRAPALIQIYDMGTDVMRVSKDVILPVSELMNIYHQKLPIKDFFPGLLLKYGTETTLLGFPFNTSVPVMYVNLNLLNKAGIAQNELPVTWNQFEHQAGFLKKQGQSCIYTSAYPAWIHIELFAKMNQKNASNLLNSLFYFDDPIVKKHMERLSQWSQKGYFLYAGRANEAAKLFISGHCPYFSQSSGSYQSIKTLAPFTVAVMPLPREKSSSHIIFGGAGLWVIQGHTDSTYRGIAAFLSYFASNEVQTFWIKKTGYLPLGITGRYASLRPKLADLFPESLITMLQKRGEPFKAVPRQAIRNINEDAMEAMFSHKKTLEAVISSSHQREARIYRRFIRQH